MTVAATSLAAYASVNISACEQRVLNTLAEHGPMIREQIAIRSGLKECSATARVHGLLAKGRLVETCELRTTRSGRAAVVVRLA